MDPHLVAKVKKKLGLREVELASSPWALGLGLMFRSRPPKGYGMLFDTRYTARHAFWMLFMRFPIDIHFLDGNGNTVDVVRSAAPLRLLRPSTWRIYKPKRACRYAVETASSSCK